MQHPSETSHAKNTARLVPLAIKSAEIVIGETADDFQGLRERYGDKQSVAVFYPAPASSDFAPTAGSQPIETLLFLDGTWRKALKLWSLNPWLGSIPAYKISPKAPSNYGIRKTKQRNGLSTLEAVSHALQLNESIDTTPLLNLQQAMQAHWCDSNHRTKTKLK
ncbi:MAG: DTW domain-containing protein YfiP [Pseudohongiellaceae bacterium]|jgi:DTW domain-containing protein YfiP